jgi:hypothetical protein
MARKNVVVHEIASAQSLAASFSTTPTIVKYYDNCSYQINITTSNSTGTFSVEVSNDYAVTEGGPEVVTNAGTWVALTLAGGTPAVAAANDTIMINLNQLPFYAMRLTYTSTVAGTGTCDVYITSKQIGG